jgi:serine/threonine protein kinase
MGFGGRNLERTTGSDYGDEEEQERMSNILQNGTVVHNRYRVVRLIGQGGMGAVYEAVDQTFGSTVALKQMFPDPNLSPLQVASLEQAFAREAHTLNHLRHPSLPRVSNHFIEAKGHFLVMDYIQGNDLADWLEQQGQPLLIQELLPWMIQVLDALEYLHEQIPPVVHRDIKPHNIKASPDGRVYLLDFGISKGISMQTDPGIGQRSVSAYTPAYAPLEQIQGMGADPRSDLFSLGATMYHLLTGVSLSDEPRRDALTRATALLSGNPDPLSPPPGLSGAVADVLMQSLAIDPRHRPPSAAAMRQVLKSAMAGQPAPRTPPARPAHTGPTIVLPPAARPAPQPSRTIPELPQPAKPAPSSRKKSSQWRIFLVVTGMLIIVLCSVLFLIVFAMPERTLVPWISRRGPIDTLKAHTNVVRSVAYSPDGATLASGSLDGTVRVWRMSDRTLLHSLEAHTSGVRVVTYSPDGTTLTSGMGDGTVKVWRVRDGTLLHSLEHHTYGVTSVVYSPDGTTLATASDDDTVKVWRVRDGTLLHSLEAHTNNVNRIAYSPDGTTLVSASDDDTVKVWRVRDGSLRHSLEAHTSVVHSVAYSPDGTTFASMSDDDTVKVWRSSDGSLLHSLEAHTSSTNDVAYSPDGTTLAVGAWYETVKVWRVRDGSLLHSLEAYAEPVGNVAYSPDGTTLASGLFKDDTVKVWRVSDGTLLRTFVGHTDTVWCVAYSPDSTTLASGSSNGTVRVWRVE